MAAEVIERSSTKHKSTNGDVDTRRAELDISASPG